CCSVAAWGIGESTSAHGESGAGAASINVGAPLNPQYNPGHSARTPAHTCGDWSASVNVGPPLNTSSNDHYAVLSRDELTIYFTSDRPGSLGGGDLWFATRVSFESPWRRPGNRGV